ncbi:HD domain-containing phosphohydrolase [Synechococcus elongatus]|uniref:HD domain-containing phosphohydrolase n=1 Tax=Synechococcus elongatus TaxID=32046 RepID=UPI000F7E6CF5|nr:HD domain-containing phosphohydrolase [Synechococcus elongatus]
MSPEELQQELQLQSMLIDRSEHALLTLKACNEALVRASGEREFLAEFCRLCVVEAGYAHAWVTLNSFNPHESLRPFASFGRLQSYVDSLQITWDDQATGQGPTGQAIKTGQIQIADWQAEQSSLAPWQEIATHYQIKTSISLPLKQGVRTLGALNIYSTQPDAFPPLEQELLAQVAQLLAYGLSSRRSLAIQDRLLDQTIQAIVQMVELRDPYTQGHENQVAQLAQAIARQLGLDENCIRGIHVAGLLHDVGKIRVPAEILSKPGCLDPIEYELIKLHPQACYDILKSIQFPWPVAEIAMQHHERLDGSGYPRQLRGKQILLAARIIAVADVIDAMISHRPYRPGLGLGVAIAEIKNNSGRLYDPRVVEACLAVLNMSDALETEPTSPPPFQTGDRLAKRGPKSG